VVEKTATHALVRSLVVAVADMDIVEAHKNTAPSLLVVNLFTAAVQDHQAP
jgi:hypothetical protein